VAIDELYNPIHKVFYELLLFTGFRKTEALTLEWKNVHEDRIHLPMTKNGRSFDLPILQLHHEILAPLRGTQPSVSEIIAQASHDSALPKITVSTAQKIWPDENKRNESADMGPQGS